MAELAPTRTHALLLTAGTSVAYLCVLLGMWLSLRVLTAPAAVIPALVAAWYFGLGGGLLVSVVFAFVNMTLLLSLGDSARAAYDALGGNVLLIAVGSGVGYLRDRVSAQLEHRKESEERYEIAARGANDGLWDWNLKTDEVYYSEPFAALLGYSPKEIGCSPDEWFARVHPDDLGRVRDALRRHLEGESERYESEHRVRRKDGSWLWVLSRGIATRDETNTPKRMTGWLTDIADRKRSEDQLRHHAFHDPLTGLPNRSLFMDRLSHAHSRARRNANHRFAIMLLDLDRFKVVNDSLGHVAGDELLVAVGHRLEACVRPGDTVARLGGDEFMLLLEDVPSTADAMAVAERIQRALSTPLPLGGHDVVASASIGIALGDANATRPHELLRDADTAMYEAKSQRTGRPVLFDASMHDKAVERLALENALRSAIERREMFVLYQPIVNLHTGAIVGFEALARWRHPTLGLISPLSFIPLAEETGMIGEIGYWVLLEACKQARLFQEKYPATPPLRMSVNMSVRQMQQDPELIDRVMRAVESTRLSPNLLALEITESVIMEDTETGAHLLEELRRRGVRVCMDDFGTGYSSLSYLHRFRVDSLKIDISFVRSLTEQNNRSELVRTILTLAKSLGLSAVAEGVETPAQLARLRELGCDEAQGYLFSAPIDAPSVEALLRNGQRW